MDRGTGGNQFMEADAGIPELMHVIHEGLHELVDWCEGDDDLEFDIAKVTINTERVPSGKVSVTVSADLLKEGKRKPFESGGEPDSGQA